MKLTCQDTVKSRVTNVEEAAAVAVSSTCMHSTGTVKNSPTIVYCKKNSRRKDFLYSVYVLLNTGGGTIIM